MKGLEAAIVKALREAGTADAQTRARIYQSARDALNRAIAKQQLEGTDSAIDQRRKLEKIINSVEAEYQKAQMRKAENPVFDQAPDERSVAEDDPGPEEVELSDDVVRPEPRQAPQPRPTPDRSRNREQSGERIEPQVRPDAPQPSPAPSVEDDDWVDADTVRGARAGRQPDAGRDLRSERPVRTARNDDPRRTETAAASRRQPRRQQAPRDERAEPEFREIYPPDNGRPRKPGNNDRSARQRPNYDEVDSREPARGKRSPAPDWPEPETLDWPEPEPDRQPARNPKRFRNTRPEGQNGKPARARNGARREPSQPPRRDPSNRSSRWEEPVLDETRPGRRAAAGAQKRRRFPIYSTILLFALVIAVLGIGFWWFVVGGLGLSSEERDMSVPNPPARVESQDFAGSPQPQGRFSDDWVRVFSPEDITNVSANSDASVELLDDGNRAALKVASANPDESGEVSFELGPGILQMMQDRESLIAITLRSSSEEPTQIYIRCDFPGLGDCGRRRFDVSYELKDIIFSVDLRGGASNGEAGYLIINPDVAGSAGAIDIYAIRIRPE